MLAYITRRVLYALPILLGVNVITFVLFFVVNSPDDMARLHLGSKHVTAQAVHDWKAERGYDKPLLWNGDAAGMAQATDTRFIVITHNPLTMSRMDRLFGVTMAERGVSQLVSVDLQTAEQFLEAS